MLQAFHTRHRLYVIALVHRHMSPKYTLVVACMAHGASNILQHSTHGLEVSRYPIGIHGGFLHRP